MRLLSIAFVALLWLNLGFVVFLGMAGQRRARRAVRPTYVEFPVTAPADPPSGIGRIRPMGVLIPFPVRPSATEPMDAA